MPIAALALLLTTHARAHFAVDRALGFREVVRSCAGRLRQLAAFEKEDL